MSGIAFNRSRNLTALALGAFLISAVLVSPAIAGAPVSQLDVVSVTYLETGQILVEGSVICADGTALARLHQTDGTWILASQTLADIDGPETAVGSFGDQIVCDGLVHPWQVTLDERSGQPFDRAIPVNVFLETSLRSPSHPHFVLRGWETFVPDTASPPEPAAELLQLDITDVTFTNAGKARVQATVSCPPGYAAYEQPGPIPHAATLQLEQRWIRTDTDGTHQLKIWPSRRRLFREQIVCTGAPVPISLRFSPHYHSFRRHVPVRVWMEVNVSDGGVPLLAMRQEEFRG
jgi:hypothetical protein